MFETICRLIPRDPAYPARTRTLDILKRVLDGRLYDALPYQFHEERGAGGEYIPLRNRRPSVRYALCRVVVEDSVSLLFSEGHFPTIDCADRNIRAALADISKETRLNLTMTEAAMRGAIGSVAILMRVLRGRVFFDILDTTYLTAEWDPQEPDTLIRVTERYKVRGVHLALNGYEVTDRGIDYWFTRRWDIDSETWFVPYPAGSSSEPCIDEGGALCITGLVSSRSSGYEICLVPHPQATRQMGRVHSAPRSRRRSKSTTS